MIFVRNTIGMLTAFRATTNNTGEKGDKKQNTLFYRCQESRLWRRAPLGNYQLPPLPDKPTKSQARKAKRSFPLAAPPSALVSNHSIFQKEKRTAWVRFSFWSSFCFIIRTFILVNRHHRRAILIVEIIVILSSYR